MKTLLVLLFAICAFAKGNARDTNTDASVYYNAISNTYSVVEGIFTDAVAYGNFNDTLDVTGKVLFIYC